MREGTKNDLGPKHNPIEQIARYKTTIIIDCRLPLSASDIDQPSVQ